MQSILTVTTAATDLTLLTMAELRKATGIASGSDDDLAAVGRRVAAAITSHCNVKTVGATPPTLRLETLTQTFRLQCPVESLILSRRPLIEIVSVTEDAVAVESTDYEMRAGIGILDRLCSDYPAWWSASKIIVVYRAGWATVPDNLRNAAMKLAAVFWSEGIKVDLSLKRESIPGVIDREWWVGPTDDPAIPREVQDLLADYINPAIG
jgi:hypothetical protein